jgi:glycine oxidase
MVVNSNHRHELDADCDELERAIGRRVAGSVFLPNEAQIRNPRHLKALQAALAHCGVTILSHTAAEAIVVRGERIEAIETREGRIVAADYCLTAGCWTSDLARRVGYSAEIKPIRGQIVLLKAARAPFQSVINSGLRYLVPRDDGRILVGSTMEDVGFDRSTTARGVRGLLDFALAIAPELAVCAVEKTWAGLRPATADGLPILGRISALQNAWIAAGHFRNGLTLSTATAENVARLICGAEPTIDLAPFSPDRFGTPQTRDGLHHSRPLAMHGA